MELLCLGELAIAWNIQHCELIESKDCKSSSESTSNPPVAQIVKSKPKSKMSSFFSSKYELLGAWVWENLSLMRFYLFLFISRVSQSLWKDVMRKNNYTIETWLNVNSNSKYYWLLLYS